jgi:hypothetical protein
LPSSFLFCCTLLYLLHPSLLSRQWGRRKISSMVFWVVTPVVL